MKHPLFRGAMRVVLSSIVLSSAASAGAFVTKHTPSGAPVHWSASSIVWSLDHSVDDVPGGAKAFRDGVAAWNGAGGGAPPMKVTVSKEERSPGLDGVSGIYHVAGGFAPAGRALAVTILNIDDATGEIVDADIVLNGAYDLQALAAGHEHTGAAQDEHDATPGETFDVRRIAAHELGHALGLADAPGEAGALMYPFVAPGAALPSSPTVDDLSGLSSIYDATRAPPAAPPSAHGCSSARTRGASPIAVALVIGALVLAVRSRRRLAAGAFAALLAAPPLAAAPSDSPRMRVTHVRTVSELGIFRSDVELANGMHATVWGGVLGGVRQEVGGAVAPREGELVDVAADPRGGIALRRVVA